MRYYEKVFWRIKLGPIQVVYDNSNGWDVGGRSSSNWNPWTSPENCVNPDPERRKQY
jgi:hypothetical protein